MPSPWEKYGGDSLADKGSSPSKKPWEKYGGSDVEDDGPKQTRGLIGETAALLDAYTGVPSRAALSALGSGKGLIQAGKDFTDYWGVDPENAPTPKDVKEAIGVPDLYLSKGRGPLAWAARLGKMTTGKEPELAENAIAYGADWVNLLPALGLLKRGGAPLKAAKAADAVSDVPMVASRFVDEFGVPIMVPAADTISKSTTQAGKIIDFLKSSAGKAAGRAVIGGAAGYGSGGIEEAIAGMIAGAASKKAAGLAKTAGKGLLSNKAATLAAIQAARGNARLSE